jgi:aminopeptidase N
MMMLWDEHRLGKEEYEFQTWLALQSYLRYVGEEHIIRPLEYRFFDSRAQIYNEQHTYLKGGIVLDMLRWILGDDRFFQGMSHFLHKHEFSNVESPDLKIALEESTGENLEWFFDQWVYGAGHPVFEVQSSYLPHLKKVKVTIKQVQPMVVGQGLFSLPVEIRIDVGGATRRTKVWVNNEEEEYLLEASGSPDMVSLDGRGALVCELRHDKSVDELAYQVMNDHLSGRLWALQQLVGNHASDPRTLEALTTVLASKVHWSLKAEATVLLRNIESKSAEDLLLGQLKSTDNHIRKAAVIALGSRFTSSARRALRSVIENDPVDDVAGAAIVALARTDNSLTPRYLRNLAQSGGWYDVRRIAVLEAIQTLGDPQYTSIAKENASEKYNYQVRASAFVAWAACSPADPELARALITAAEKEILPVREEALTLLGELKIEEALPVLEELAAHNGDSDIRNSARTAIDKILRGEVR